MWDYICGNIGDWCLCTKMLTGWSYARSKVTRKWKPLMVVKEWITEREMWPDVKKLSYKSISWTVIKLSNVSLDHSQRLIYLFVNWTALMPYEAICQYAQIFMIIELRLGLYFHYLWKSYFNMIFPSWILVLHYSNVI